MKIAIHAAVSSSGAKIPAARANAVSAILGVFNGRGCRTRGISSHHGTVRHSLYSAASGFERQLFRNGAELLRAELENARVSPKGLARFRGLSHASTWRLVRKPQQRTRTNDDRSLKNRGSGLTKPGCNQPSIRAREDLHYQSVRAKRGLESCGPLSPQICETTEREYSAKHVVAYCELRGDAALPRVHLHVCEARGSGTHGSSQRTWSRRQLAVSGVYATGSNLLH